MNEAWGHYHTSCSCKTGAEGDARAILDNNFRVRGTTNLRVVDTLIFPYIPGFLIVPPTLYDRGEGKRDDFSGRKQVST